MTEPLGKVIQPTILLINSSELKLLQDTAPSGKCVQKPYGKY